MMDTPTVLLIDDDREQILLFSMILQREGFRVVSAQVSRQTISFPPHENPVVILLDYKLNSSLTPAEIAIILKLSYPATLIFVLSLLQEMPAVLESSGQGFISKKKKKE